MKAILPIIVTLILVISSCSRDKAIVQTIPIPNGDFETWDNMSLLANWETNSCPVCVPPYETYIVTKDSSAYHGRFAAKFVYNNVYASWAENKFSIPRHPSNLTGYVKCNLFGTDTVTIKIKLYNNTAIVDSGKWLGTSSIVNYLKINIPITQSSSYVDSALIRIQGGRKIGYPNSNTEFWVDNLSLE
jgi:hypothetical protein